ncbi:MAG: hemolysin family protein [Coriobacteriales bacterium]|jgi:putative hemolysin|nr:hemolysin family protein [Coriobacteriales bacterium]
MTIIFSVLLTIILVILNGFFAMSEMALVNASRAALQLELKDCEQEQSPERGKRAKRALDLTERPDRFLATVQVGTTLVGFGASAVAASTFSVPITAWLQSFRLAWLSAIAGPLSVIVTTIVISYVTLVIGELVPKRIALSDPERSALRIGGVITAIETITAPLVSFLSLSTNAVSRVFGIKKAQPSDEVSEDELKYIVSEQPGLLEDEKKMIGEIFDLDATSAAEIMTPRVDTICVEDDMTVKQTVERMRGTGFSRLPVFHETPDKIIGLAMLKDLLVPVVDKRQDELITEYMRSADFVPESQDILSLLKEMRRDHIQLVVVEDEHGGIAGVVSIEDIIEEIVGEIYDEYDRAPKGEAAAQAAPNVDVSN